MGNLPVVLRLAVHRAVAQRDGQVAHPTMRAALLDAYYFFFFLRLSRGASGAFFVGRYFASFSRRLACFFCLARLRYSIGSFW